MRDIAQYEADYFQQPFVAQQVRFRKKRLLESLAEHEHRFILEIGCGLDPLYRHPVDFERLMIVEPAEAFYLSAREGAGDRHDTECVQGFLEDVAPLIADSSFDFIILSSLLHEVESPDTFLGTVRSLCGPQTVVHIDVPNAHSFHRLLAVEMGLIGSVYEASGTQVQMQQHGLFDQQSLVALVTRVGFKVIRQGSFFLKPFTHRQMAALVESGFASEQMLLGLYRMVPHMPGLGSEIFVDVRLGQE